MISKARTALREPQNVARLSRAFAASLCAGDVAEPLVSHAQELEAEHLATAVRLASFIPTILRGEGVQRIVDSQRTSGDAAPQFILHPIATSTSS